MDIEESLNLRAISLSPVDSVLFLFNLESGFNYNNTDVTISEIKGTEPGGRTAVHVTGLDNRGLTGVGPVQGVSRFTYLRPDLATINIPDDGSFFNIFRDGPNFLGAIDEFKRRTTFNCSAIDFDEEAFYPDENGDRWLKAKPGSWRFIGKLKLGRPKREDIAEALNVPVRASLSIYNGVFFNNTDRLRLNLVISHRPEDYTRLVQGMTLVTLSDPLIAFILEHLARKNIEAGMSASTIGGINLYGARVTYKGVLRSADVAPLPSVDRVIALSVAAPDGLWSHGEIRLFYSSKGNRSLSYEPSTVTSFSMLAPVVAAAKFNAALAAAVKGKRLAELTDARSLSELFFAATGYVYEPELYGSLVVDYSGPQRPQDQLPVGVRSAKVVVYKQAIPMPIALSGKLKFYYEAG